MTKSRQALDGKIVHISPRVAIYKIVGSPYWRARIWLPAKRKRAVRSTRTTVRIEAIKIAEEFASSLSSASFASAVPRTLTFDHFADMFIKWQKELVAQNKRHPHLQSSDYMFLYTEKGGLVRYFAGRDIRSIQTKDMLEYLDHVRAARPEMRSTSSVNHIISCFRKVMRMARDQGVVSTIVSTPRPERHETPRNFFRFAPLVDQNRSQYKQLLEAAKKLAKETPPNAETRVTMEMYEFILWQIHTFMRPTTSEAFAVRFRDIEIAKEPKRLLITLKKGKTGYRVVNSMPAAVSVYQRLSKRNHSPDDFLFFPHLTNRTSASHYMARMFRVVLKEAKLEKDEYGSGAYTLYSLRHTSICMRLVNSEGKVNIYSLAKNAGTSVAQIERFYAKNLPLSPELARNLQSFGGDED